MRVHARARGFTLTEAAVAMALVGIIAVAATSLYASVTRTFANTRKSAMLTDRAQSAIDYLMHDLRSIGGNGIPASAAIFVEDAAPVRADAVLGFPDGTDAAASIEGRSPILGAADRLTTFTALKNVPPCTISTITGPTGDGRGTAQFFLPPSSAYPPGTCCFTTGVARPFIRTVMFTNPPFYRPVLLTNDSGTCVFQWQDIVPDQMRSPAPLIEDFVDGSAVLVDFRTYYVDPQTHDLVMHLDHLDPQQISTVMNNFGDGPTVAGERMRILDGVYDFQVSLGYDLDDSGDVTDTNGADEWLYNVPSESSAAMTNFDADLLRLVRLELVVGIPSAGVAAGSPVRAPARTGGMIAVPGVHLRAVGARFAPRNVDISGGG